MLTPALLESSKKTKVIMILPNTNPFSSTKVWERMSDLPVTESTAVSLHNQLLAVGGRDSEFSLIDFGHLQVQFC